MTATAETQAPDAAYEQLAERLEEQLAANASLAAENDRLRARAAEQRDALAAHVERLGSLWEGFLNAGAEKDGAAMRMQEAVEDAPATSLARRDAENRELGMLQGACVAAAMVAPWQEVMAREILTSFGVRSGSDLDGCAEYDLAELIKHKVRIPGLHAAWSKARREERRQAEQADTAGEAP